MDPFKFMDGSGCCYCGYTDVGYLSVVFSPHRVNFGEHCCVYFGQERVVVFKDGFLVAGVDHYS